MFLLLVSIMNILIFLFNSIFLLIISPKFCKNDVTRYVLKAGLLSKIQIMLVLDEPCCEKTGLRGFRPGPTQT